MPKGKAGRMGARLMAIVAEGERGRVYLAPTAEMEAMALKAQARVEAGYATAREVRESTSSQLRHGHLWRPLHPPPTRGADDLLRPGAGSARAGEARRRQSWICPTIAKP